MADKPFVVRFAVEKDKPVERPLYLGTYGGALAEGLTTVHGEVNVLRWATREAAQRQADKRTARDLMGYDVYYGYVVEEAPYEGA